MLLGKRTITVYPWHCTCGQELLFEDADFEDKCIFEGTANEVWIPYVNVPCLNCGKVWSNISKQDLYPREITV